MQCANVTDMCPDSFQYDLEDNYFSSYADMHADIVRKVPLEKVKKSGSTATDIGALGVHSE